MQQFKALILKEYWTHKKSLMTSIFIILGLYLLIAITMIFAYIKSEHNYQEFMEMMVNQNGISGIDLTFWALGCMSVVIAAIVLFFSHNGFAIKLLNDDWKYKCELFHNSLPVSILTKTIAKLTFITGSNIILLLGLSIINVIFQYLLILLLAPSQYLLSGFFLMFLGFIQSFLLVLFGLTFGFAVSWLFAAIFKTNTNSKSTLIMAIIMVSGIVIGRILGIREQLYSALMWFLGLLIPKFQQSSYPDIISSDILMRVVIFECWRAFFSFHTIKQIIMASIFIFIGIVVINRREVL